jgi:hypothetical protein
MMVSSKVKAKMKKHELVEGGRWKVGGWIKIKMKMK